MMLTMSMTKIMANKENDDAEVWLDVNATMFMCQ